VLRGGAEASAEELIEWTREKIGAVKPRHLRRLSSRTCPSPALGKVLRREVKAPFWQDAERTGAGA